VKRPPISFFIIFDDVVDYLSIRCTRLKKQGTHSTPNMPVPSSLPKNTLEFLASFVDTVKTNPQTLQHPELGFFKDYLLSLGATLPTEVSPKSANADGCAKGCCPATGKHGHGHGHGGHGHGQRDSVPETKAAAPEESSESSDDEEEDDAGRVAPDSPPYPTLPTFGGEGDWEKAGALKQQGQEAIRNNNYDQAVDFYSQALAHQASGMTLTKRAAALLDCTPPRPNASVSDCDCALSQNPDSAKAMKVRGKAHRMLGNYVKAAADLRKGQSYDFDPTTAALLKEVEQFATKIEGRLNKKRLVKEAKEQEDKLAARKAAAVARKRRQEEAEQAAEQAAHGHGHSHGGNACNGDHSAQGGMPGGMPSGGMPGGGMPGGMPGGFKMPGMGGGGMPQMPAGMDMGKMMGMMQDPEVMGKDGSLLSCCGVAG
jgi:suppressor of tumorigenicity protein 13